MNNKEARELSAKLIIENPDVEIRFKVDSDLFDDCYSWFVGRMGEPEIGELWEYYDTFYDERDELIDHLICGLDMDEKEAEKIADTTGKKYILVLVIP